MTAELVIIIVDGVPVAKGRHRLSTVNGYPQMHPDPKSKRYENNVGMQAKFAMLEASARIFDEPLSVIVEAFLPIAKSWSAKKKDAALSGAYLPQSKPDVDNLCKAALDACNKIVWRDDSLICDLTVIKRYSDRPRLVMTVKPAALGLEAIA